MLVSAIQETECVDEIIFDYFQLPNRIQRAKAREDYYNWLFYQQSFTPCPNAYDEIGHQIQTPPLLTQVEELIEYQRFNAKIVKYLERKRDAFVNYLASLSSSVADQLERKYSLGHDVELDMSLVDDVVIACNLIEVQSAHLYIR